MTTEVKKTTPETKPKKRKSYFAKNTVNRYFLDEEFFIEHKKLDEGLFQAYQDITSRIKIGREDESTEVDMALGRQRKFLVENLVTNWNLIDDDDEPVRYSPEALSNLDPAVISGLIADIYSKNEILSGESEDSGK